MLLGSLLSYGMATALIVHLVVRLIRTGYTGLGLWKNVAVMMIVSLVTAAAHLIQIALWAVAFLLIGEISTFETAVYYSAQNYTALGYGDIVLSDRWRFTGSAGGHQWPVAVRAVHRIHVCGLEPPDHESPPVPTRPFGRGGRKLGAHIGGWWRRVQLSE